MVDIGDKRRFTPSAFADVSESSSTHRDFGVVAEVTGTVIQIHAEHHWYRVAYEVAGTTQHETFKF